MTRGADYPLPWDFFAPGQPIVLAWAPARLDVMGGIADYSGATVLELPLAHGALVAAQLSADDALTVRTGGPAVPQLVNRGARISTDVLYHGDPRDAPRRLRAALDKADAAWAAYLLGPLAILEADADTVGPRVSPVPRGLDTRRGLRLAVWSDVPAGAGVSSSAALEVAALRTFEALFGLDLDPLALVRLAQQAEHRVALAPCGIMDQATAALGRKDHLLMLRCQPAEALGQRPLPTGVRVLGIDSGVAHHVSGAQYGRARTAAFMGRAIIHAHDPSDPPGGYLCNLDPARFAGRYAALLPHELDGAAFLARYGETGDDATRVDPGARYRVRDCTAHPVYEQANVAAFLTALDRYERASAKGSGVDMDTLEEAGAAMYRSHASYGDRCGLGSPETDLIVDLVRAAGPDRGLYGAKITGGGAGGTVAVLGAGPHMRETAEDIAAEYALRTGNRARVIAGSGEGAVATPVERAIVDANGEVRLL